MTTARPQISVIIPTYNRANLLSRAIKSVLEQTFTDFELIIVDDASKDDTELLIKRFQDQRLRYIRHHQNMGGPAARNTGIREAQGEYIAFLDDDDEYLPIKLTATFNELNHAPEGVGLVYSQVKLVDSLHQDIFPYFGKSGNIFLDMLGGPLFHISSTLIRKRYIVLYDESLPRYQDVDFHLRILEKAETVFVKAVTAIWHQKGQGQRITSNIKALEDACKIVEDKYFIKMGYHNNRDVYSRFLKTMGNIFILENGALKLGRSYLRRSLRYRLNVITLFDFLASFLGCTFYRLAHMLKITIYLKLHNISHKECSS